MIELYSTRANGTAPGEEWSFVSSFGLDMVTRSDGPIHVLALSGELDLATAPPLLRTLRRLADTGDDVIIDMENVRYIDSQGVRALRTAHQVAVLQGRAIRLRGCRGIVDRVLRMVGLDRILPMG